MTANNIKFFKLTGQFLISLLLLSSPCFADDSIWIRGSVATLQTLDKVTARIDRKTVQIGQPFSFGSLTITVHHCSYRPPEAPPEHAGFLVISDAAQRNDAPRDIPPGNDELRDDPPGNDTLNSVQTGGPHDGKTVFSGWMFASSPAISGLEHAVYDVTLLSCNA